MVRTIGWLRVVALTSAVVSGAAATGCKTRDPEYCESNNECEAKGTGKTVCDILGAFGPGRTCVRPGDGGADGPPADIPRLDFRFDRASPETDASDTPVDSTR